MPPTRTSSGDSGVRDSGIRKKMRKGTHSCFECRRRKIRCVFAVDNPSVCTECFARGSRCVDQEHAENDVVVDHRKNLRERVAKLESLVEALLDDKTRPRTAELLHRLDSVDVTDSASQSPDEDRGVSYSDSNVDGPPMMSLFSNDVISRVAAESGHSSIASPDDQLPTPDCQSPSTVNLAYRFCDSTNTLDDGDDKLPTPSASKTQKTMQTLKAALPTLDGLLPLLARDDRWWVLFGKKCPGTRGKATLEEFATRVLADGSVCELGTLVLCYGTVSEEPTAIDQCLTLVDRLILSDDEHMGTLEGLECALLQCKIYADIGQVRRAWLTCRRAIGLAQLMGLHRAHATSPVKSSIWWMLYIADRLTSLMLGMPYAVSDIHCNMNIGGMPLEQCFEQHAFSGHVARFAGKVIDLNQSCQASDHSAAVIVDQEMNKFANKMSLDYWYIEPLPTAPDTDTILAWQDRILGQICFHQTRVYLHMPFMLKSITNAKFDHSRQVCFSAAREMLRLYHILRADGTPVYECKAIDFVGFTAAIVIILGLLGYGRLAQQHDPESDESDWNLVERSTEIFKQASTEPGGKVAEQSYRALQTLSQVRKYNVGGPTTADANAQAKIAIPFFGTITIQRGQRFKHVAASPSAATCRFPSKGRALPSPASTSSPTESGSSRTTPSSAQASSSNMLAAQLRQQPVSQHPIRQPASVAQWSTQPSQYNNNNNAARGSGSIPSSTTTDPFIAYDGFLSLPDLSFGNSDPSASASASGSSTTSMQSPFSFPTAAFEGSPMLQAQPSPSSQQPQPMSAATSSVPQMRGQQSPMTFGNGNWPMTGGFSWGESVGHMDIDQDWSWYVNGDNPIYST